MIVPTFADVEDAARQLQGVAVTTPLLRSEALDAAAGGKVFVKAECLQRTGSFKIRGAYNRLSRLTEAERRGGVVAFSSGNHAQGVAASRPTVPCPAMTWKSSKEGTRTAPRSSASRAEISSRDWVKRS